MKSIDNAAHAIENQAFFDKVHEMIGFFHTAVETGQTAHEVESGLWKRVLELGRCAFGAYLGLFGDGDAGERIVLDAGREVRRLPALHRREYRNPFGLFTLERAVYGTREGQKIEHVPLDARLGLPQGKNSYLLQDWDQSLAVEMPYAQVGTTLDRILGFAQSVHTLERDQREMAKTVSAFWQAQPIPPAEQEGALLVCTADGKGVPMRGAPAAAEPPAPASPGMRPGTKKMALIGAVYTVDPLIRTPDEVLEALLRESSPGVPHEARPKPCFKYVRAALERDSADGTAPQTHAIFHWMAQQAMQRNPEGNKPLLVLMDGQESLWKAAWNYLPKEPVEVTEILDLLHAIGYLWEAAHLLYPSSAEAARSFLKAQARRMLHGEIAAVIDSLRWLGTAHKLKGERRQGLERICGYFLNNAHRMAYDVYLEHGFPIASGVIEGACRCVVKDRMERSGMRWVISGARAMLGLRSISLSGLWDAFAKFRIQHESLRLYPGSAAKDPDYRQPLVA